MTIRNSSIADLNRIMEIYARARLFMKETGNPNQWKTHPKQELIESDIINGISYVIESNGIIVGTFALLNGPDQTYNVIDGSWLNNDEYGVIHRIASDGSTKGILRAAVAYSLERYSNIRMDTHFDNKVMQNALLSIGFFKCGTIYIEDDFSSHSTRIAFQIINKKIL